MDAAQACYARDRFSRFCGVQLVAATPGWAKACLRLKSAHLNGLSCVHGGAIFTLADFAFAMAVNAHGQVALAIQCSMTYLRAAHKGVLWAEAREVSKTSRLATYEVEVREESGELIARFQGLAYLKTQPVPKLMPRKRPARRRTSG